MNDILKSIDRKKMKATLEKSQEVLTRLESTIFNKAQRAPHQVIQLTKEKIKEFIPIFPVEYDLCNPDFKTYHIGDLSRTIEVNIPENLEISMKELVASGILKHAEVIKERSELITKQKKNKKGGFL